MAYEKKKWHTGDVIDADGLNNIEEGVAALDEVVGSSNIDVVKSDVEQLKDDMQIVDAHFPATGKFVSGTGSATANYAHAEGDGASASGSASHAEGSATEARGDYSHTEGYSTIADGESAHAEGDSTGAKGDASHASGEGTVANRKAQTVFGRYNVGEQTSAALAKQYGDYVEIVGNGNEDDRSNARTLDWSGNEKLAGGLTLGMGTADEVELTAAELSTIKPWVGPAELHTSNENRITIKQKNRVINLNGPGEFNSGMINYDPINCVVINSEESAAAVGKIKLLAGHSYQVTIAMSGILTDLNGAETTDVNVMPRLTLLPLTTGSSYSSIARATEEYATGVRVGNNVFYSPVDQYAKLTVSNIGKNAIYNNIKLLVGVRDVTGTQLEYDKYCSGWRTLSL